MVGIAERAITAYNSQQSGGLLAADPFTFQVPVTLAGVFLHAGYRVSGIIAAANDLSSTVRDT